MNIYVITGFTRHGSDIIGASRNLEEANSKAEAWLRDALSDYFTSEEIDQAFEAGEEFDLYDEYYFKVQETTLD
jgi:hypothetical protein